jgi:phosphatidylinositol phospholipase C, delta
MWVLARSFSSLAHQVANYEQVLTRGCRCIEIDVHNGEPADSKANHSRSPSTHSETKGEHKRHISISGSTMSSRAAAALEKAEEKFDSAKAKIAEKIERTGLGSHSSSYSNSEEQRGRPATTNSLEVGSPNGKRPASVRSMRSGEPLVLHGWTLTAPVGFRAVCRTIRETAFVTSNLPIIISLEVHADVEQQEKMVDIMQEEWKGLLIDQAHEACNPDERLPRLEELLNKILIKVKKASSDKLAPSPSTNSLAPVKSRTDGDSGQSGSEDERSTQKKKVKICERLSNLGIYTHSEHFVSFEAKSARKPPHVFSIGESMINELHDTKKEQLIAHNRDFFMRAYPAGFRIDSSNLDPSGFWRKGVQMVALNWQNCDMGMMLNEGMFAGENGWVLKPPGYRSDPNEPIRYKALDLKITVYAGQHIPIPANQTERGFHPYIRCDLHVQKPEIARKDEGNKDEVKKREAVDPADYKQKTPYRKGDHPDFGEEGHVLAFRTVEKVVEELSFVRYVPIVAFSPARINLVVATQSAERPAYPQRHGSQGLGTPPLTCSLLRLLFEITIAPRRAVLHWSGKGQCGSPEEMIRSETRILCSVSRVAASHFLNYSSPSRTSHHVVHRFLPSLILFFEWSLS